MSEEFSHHRCHCCGKKIDGGFNRCRCYIAKWCYGCHKCFQHCTCEGGPTPLEAYLKKLGNAA